MRMSLLLLALPATLVPGWAQAPRPVTSPEVNADHSVTFRFRAPGAKEVFLSREGADRVPMQKDADGLWTATTPPLEPDLYGYGFVADGVTLMDPNNASIKPNLLNPQSVVHVPGPASLPWEINNVPRGMLHRHFYHSAVVGDDRDFFVYTPPGFAAGRTYPVLYLLHGFSDDASGWTAVGRAHIIFDNLLAQRKIRPMLVVMTLGYGDLKMVARNSPAFRDQALVKRNYDNYRDALFTEVMPEVERRYGASKDRTQRAIAGLSMGGAESLFVGLNGLDRFAWIGAFSAGGLNEDFDATFPKLDSSANRQIRLLWIACGTEDRLIDFNRKVRGWLKAKGVEHTAVETPGMHTWMVWRRNLATFAPLLFQGGK